MIWIPGGRFSWAQRQTAEVVAECQWPPMTPADPPRPRRRVLGGCNGRDERTVSSSSLKATDMSPSRNGPRKRRISPLLPPKIWSRDQLFLRDRSGGPLDIIFHVTYIRARTGGTPRADSDLKGKEKYPVVQVAYPTSKPCRDVSAKRRIPLRRRRHMVMSPRVRDLDDGYFSYP